MYNSIEGKEKEEEQKVICPAQFLGIAKNYMPVVF